MTSHEHRPDYAAYHRRRSARQLTCIHCNKPIRCTNERLNWFGLLPVIPILIAYICQNRLAFGLSILAAGLLNDLLNRYIFPKLHFEIDTDALRSELTQRRP